MAKKRKRLHWTQRPENREKVKATMKQAAKARRKHAKEKRTAAATLKLTEAANGTPRPGWQGFSAAVHQAALAGARQRLTDLDQELVALNHERDELAAFLVAVGNK